MERIMYESLIKLENDHWWFWGRRAIMRWVMRKAKLPANAQIVDIGCGAGGNMVPLSAYGQVHGVEYEKMVRDHALARGIGPVEDGKLPEHFPYGDKKFDLAAMFDVLEHIEQDVESLKVIYSRLNPGGYVFVTVPAFNWMMSAHDAINHHHRRYSRAGLRARFEEAGFEVKFINYFNFTLFPITLVSRLLAKLKPKPADGEYRYTFGQGLPHPVLNRLLYTVMSGETAILNLPLPWGISITALAQKPANKA